MKQIPEEAVDFLRSQSFVVISSIDENGFPHNSAKAIVKIDSSGEIYLIDVYQGLTCKNIKLDSKVSISAIDEHNFVGYCLKGRAKILPNDKINQEVIKTWEDNLTSRLTKRLIKNLANDKSQRYHPEASLPQPKHIIAVEIEQIVDLSPFHLRKEK